MFQTTNLGYPDANHGAGIFTYKTVPYFWGKYVGKYSSTMVRIWDKQQTYFREFPGMSENRVLYPQWRGEYASLLILESKDRIDLKQQTLTKARYKVMLPRYAV